MQQIILHLITASGNVNCLRCTAQSRRTGKQCGRPALKVSKTQKCQYHGGRNSGPKSDVGKTRIAAAHMVHGQESKAAKAARSAASARLRQLEDVINILGMTSVTRTRGRKPTGYVQLRTLSDVKQWALDTSKNGRGGSNEGPTE